MVSTSSSLVEFQITSKLPSHSTTPLNVRVPWDRCVTQTCIDVRKSHSWLFGETHEVRLCFILRYLLFLTSSHVPSSTAFASTPFSLKETPERSGSLVLGRRFPTCSVVPSLIRGFFSLSVPVGTLFPPWGVFEFLDRLTLRLSIKCINLLTANLIFGVSLEVSEGPRV